MNKKCPLCEWDASAAESSTEFAWRFRCERSGDFVATRRWLVDNVESPRAAHKAMLPALEAYIRARNKQGEVPVRLTDDWLERAAGHARTPVRVKLRKLLELLAEEGRPGTEVRIDPVREAPAIDAVDSEEVLFYLRHLQAANLVQSGPELSGYVLTIDGWQQVGPGPGGIPGQCFVAMAFDPSLDGAFDDGIEPAIRDCDLLPVRLDRQEYNGRVDDQIEVEIRRAEFVIADVTLQRHGVYYEAGFAIALGRPVIWSCREDDFSNVHFDTRQYNYIVWNDARDLRKKLMPRIEHRRKCEDSVRR